MPISTPEGSFESVPFPPLGPEQRTADSFDKAQELMTALENFAPPNQERAIIVFEFDIFRQEGLKTILPVGLANYLADQQGKITVRNIEVAFDSTAGTVQRSDLSVTFDLEDLESGLNQQLIVSKPDNFTAADPFDIAHISNDGKITEVHHQPYAADEISRLITCLALPERDWDSIRYAKNVLDPQDKPTMLLLKDPLISRATRYSLDTKYEYVLDEGKLSLGINRIKSEENANLYEIEIAKRYYGIDHNVHGRNITNIKTTAMLVDEAPTDEAVTPLFAIFHRFAKSSGETITESQRRPIPRTPALEAIFEHYMQETLIRLSKTRKSDISYETYLDELDEE